MLQNQSGSWITRILSACCAFYKRKSLRQQVLSAASRGDYSLLLQKADTTLNEVLWHYGSDHPETARKLAAVAAIQAMRGENAEAVSLYRRAISILSHSSNEQHSAEALTLWEQLAQLLSHCDDSVAAQKIYIDLLSRFTAIHQDRPHADLARTMDNLALVLKEQGQNAEARKNHRNALLIWEEVRGPGSPEVARCLTHLASLYLAERRYDEAEPLLLRAVAAWKSSPNPHDLYAIITLSCCGDLYRSTGRGAEARNAEDAAKAVLARYAK